MRLPMVNRMSRLSRAIRYTCCSTAFDPIQVLFHYFMVKDYYLSNYSEFATRVRSSNILSAAKSCSALRQQVSVWPSPLTAIRCWRSECPPGSVSENHSLTPPKHLARNLDGYFVQLFSRNELASNCFALNIYLYSRQDICIVGCWHFSIWFDSEPSYLFVWLRQYISYFINHCICIYS